MPDFRTETQKLTDLLRESVLAGEFQPGDRLPQRAIAERFSTTPMVAREALRSLSSEGLVVVQPRFGAMVQDCDADLLQQRYLVREALEGMAARLAAERSSSVEVERLLSLAADCDNKLPSDGCTSCEKARLHTDFHELVVLMAKCEELGSHLNGILLHSIIVSNAYHIDWHNDRPRTHTHVAETIASGDGDEAERAMRAHIRVGLKMELTAIERGLHLARNGRNQGAG